MNFKFTVLGMLVEEKNVIVIELKSYIHLFIYTLPIVILLSEQVFDASQLSI